MLLQKAVLVVSSIGYETQEVPVNGRQFINVVLKSDVVTLKDVVVVGYGVQKKSQPDRSCVFCFYG